MARFPTIEPIAAFVRSYRRQEIHESSLTPAAVLIPLFEYEASLHVLLTKRTETVEHHKGQISFPGGARDESDPSIIATALREAEEEIGLPAASVEVLGAIDDFATPSGFVITPVVGFIPHLPDLRPHASEVAEILFVPLSVFLDPENERTIVRERNGVLHRVYLYPFGPHEIWGATAAIIREFLLALRRAGIEVGG